ncbi:hypothetical protein DM860_005015 [Cuscuta australis]|uniref:Uncharacterized protein n=1 Tax=Cuscuta australis TaxID=267555 RepID=A0A328DMN5_9ASTE|nr:hypothetical protein DM860_005015 [Cuscuta australis]
MMDCNCFSREESVLESLHHRSLVEAQIMYSSSVPSIVLSLHSTPIRQPVLPDPPSLRFFIRTSVALPVAFPVNLWTSKITSNVRTAFKLSNFLNPDLVINRVGFLTRFTKTLNYYSLIFESLDPNLSRDSPGRLQVERLMLSQRILVMVGMVEPAAQFECNEEKEHWMVFMKSAGFESLLVSNDAKTEALILLSKKQLQSIIWTHWFSSGIPLFSMERFPTGDFPIRSSGGAPTNQRRDPGAASATPDITTSRWWCLGSTGSDQAAAEVETDRGGRDGVPATVQQRQEDPA